MKTSRIVAATVSVLMVVAFAAGAFSTYYLVVPSRVTTTTSFTLTGETVTKDVNILTVTPSNSVHILSVNVTLLRIDRDSIIYNDLLYHQGVNASDFVGDYMMTFYVYWKNVGNSTIYYPMGCGDEALDGDLLITSTVKVKITTQSGCTAAVYPVAMSPDSQASAFFPGRMSRERFMLASDGRVDVKLFLKFHPAAAASEEPPMFAISGWFEA